VPRNGAFSTSKPTRAVVEAAVAERSMRMQTNRVDLLQVHTHLSISTPYGTDWQFYYYLFYFIVALE